MIKNIAIFCASSEGNDAVYMQSAYALGSMLAQRGIAIVYGGAKVGLMGAVADGALSQQGKVIGVIPGFLKHQEIAHTALSELIEVETMHARKLKMHALSDAIITLPGGFGTMEELFEMLTWAQLKLHFKPIGLLNINGYYDPLVTMIDHMVQAGLLHESYQSLLMVAADMDTLLAAMEARLADIS
jgi:uncharacterized protein (TIGR00730 family)